jgi:hypothetical protein
MTVSQVLTAGDPFPATVLIAVIAAVILAFLSGGCDRESELCDALQRMGVVLPDSASDVHLEVSSGMAYVVFLRFDTDSRQVEQFLAESKYLPNADELAGDGRTRLDFGQINGVPWWNVPEEASPVSAYSESNFVDHRGHGWCRMCTVAIVDLGSGRSRVFIEYGEDPGPP